MITKTLTIQTNESKEVVDITEKIEDIVQKYKPTVGICLVFTTHTTCCLTTGEVGEGTDHDLLEVAEKIVPNLNFRHAHNPSHAWTHMISSLIGPSLAIPIEQGRLVLGVWQSVLLLEFDGPRKRNIKVVVVGK